MPVEDERANNEKYSMQIYDLLHEFVGDLEYRGWNNLTDWHTYAEDVMRAVLEPTFDYRLTNANVSRANAAAFDLGGTNAAGERALIQVSTDDSRGKVQGTLNKLGDDGAGCHLETALTVFEHKFGLVHPNTRVVRDTPELVLGDLTNSDSGMLSQD